LKIDKNNKRHVLIISFYAPPTNAIGAVRIGKLAKYLPEYGWDPVILTVDKIESLPTTLEIESDEKKIYRTPLLSYGELIAGLFPDENAGSSALPTRFYHRLIKPRLRFLAFQIARMLQPVYSSPRIYGLMLGWYRSAVREGLEIVRDRHIDIIYSSFDPAASHLIASRLNQKTGVPWIAEFRDAWSGNDYNRRIPLLSFFERYWEKRTLKNCDLLISLASPLAKTLDAIHSCKSIVIPNGYDEEDFTGSVPGTTKFTLNYTGNIYPGKRDPSPLFQALAELRRERIIGPDNFEVRFFGYKANENITPFLKKYDVDSLVRIGGYLPYKESLRSQQESTALLLLSWNDPRDSGTLTGKIFEYMGAGRPVLAVAFKGGEIDRLLHETGCGIVINEASEIKNVLLKWLAEFRDSGKIHSFYSPRKEIIKQYTRQDQARQTALLLDKVYGNRMKNRKKIQ
jgi:glycosyltransferase involved in cell wall biosynthesis